MAHPVRLTTLAALLGLLLAACGEKPAPAGHAALKVNGAAISAAEVEAKLKQYSQLPAEQKTFVTGTILDSLTDLELLRQAAVREKLDADEAVQARLAGAARFILAEAYMEKTKAAVPKPSAADVKAYYDQHPARYAERKLFDLQEVNIETTPENTAEIESRLKNGASLNDFVGWLQFRKLQYDVQPLVVPAEKVVEPILDKLAQAHDGDVITLPGKNKLTALFINKVLSEPLTLEQATPMIEGQRYEAGRTERMQETMKQLRDQAKIEYLPPYQASRRPAPATR
ncbi:MAG: EpsD family peptidyl-prolyl cis-trans isomerase [Gallionellaceae bacterium]|nr:EpsD family peptidyl-prolyl cis-trans isomerase [Gallionellaceae bacterium]